MPSVVNHKRWIWTELLGFDVRREDCGMQDYLQTLGFVPDGVSLLLSTPDFILQHEGLEHDAVLPPDTCSRNGQEGNEERARQEWSRFQLRKLVAGLRRAGCQVYFSVFTNYLNDRFHHEWLSDHPEAMVVSAPEGRRDALFPLARLTDGTHLQDFFAEQIARVCLDYGFDGWHGSDGYGPQWSVFKFGCGDDFVAQFAERGYNLPECVTAPCDDQPEALARRMDWIWRHRRLDWIEFYSDRWAEFWKTVTDSLHAIGRRAMINSAWTKDPFEAKYRYGIDYRKIAEAGVDAMMVETCAGGILLGSDDRDYHSDYLAMLMLIRACVPETELIFLLNVKDVAEDWDLLRHAPAMLEREVYALANVYRMDGFGNIGRCVDGFMVCLADGITSAEWKWLSDRWDQAFGEVPTKVLGATLLWSDAMLDAQLAGFPMARNASSHYLAFKLLEHNAPIQAVARLEHLGEIEGPFLILNPHLLSEVERAAALDAGKALILIGPDFSGWPEPAFEHLDEGIGIGLYGFNVEAAEGFLLNEKKRQDAASIFPADPLSIEEPTRFREELLFRPVPEDFLKICAGIIQRITGTYSVENQRPGNLATHLPLKIGLLMMEFANGILRVAIKNRSTVYGRPIVDLGRKIESIRVRSTFPVTKVRPDGGKFKVVVPPQGIVVLDLTTQAEINPKT